MYNKCASFSCNMGHPRNVSNNLILAVMLQSMHIQDVPYILDLSCISVLASSIHIDFE